MKAIQKTKSKKLLSERVTAMEGDPRGAFATWGRRMAGRTRSILYVLRHGLFLSLYSYIKKASSKLPWRSRTSSPFTTHSLSTHIRNVRLMRISGVASSFLLGLLALATLVPLYNVVGTEDTEAATEACANSGNSSLGTNCSITFTSTRNTATAEITPTANPITTSDNFASSISGTTDAAFSIGTNNAQGYDLKISSSAGTTLKPSTTATTDESLTALTTSTGITKDSTSFTNNTWGYLPSYYKGTANTDKYYPITTSTTTLRTTTSANPTNTYDDYTIGIGAKVDMSRTAGTYTLSGNTSNPGSITLSYVANPTGYEITYADNSGDSTVSNMPTTKQTGSVSATSIALAPNRTPTRTGYSLTGWCLGEVTSSGTTCSGTTIATNGSLALDRTATSNKATLYALWTPNQYSCRKYYRLQDANGSFPNSYTADGSELVSYNDTCTYSKSYNYYKGSANGTNNEQVTKTATMNSTNGIDIYMDLYRNTYSLTVSAGSNTSSATGSGTYRWGQTVSVGVTAPTNTTCLTYSTPTWSQSGTTGTFSSTSGASTNFTMGKGSSSLTASSTYTRSTYTISYNANGGSGTTMSNTTASCGASTTLRTNTYTRSGYTFLGWSTSSTATSASYTTSINLSRTTALTLYAVWSADPVTYSATIYYNASSTNGGTDIRSTTISCDTVTDSSCSPTIPDAVKNSVGTYNNAYAGLASTTGTMSSTTSLTLNSSTNRSEYYAVYRSSAITNYYYNSGWTTRSLYRNQWFTSDSAMATTVLASSTTDTYNVETATGYNSSTWVGLSTTSSAIASPTYSDVPAAATSTTNYTELYSVYSFSITYQKGNNVSSIGATSGSCNFLYNSTSCSVTLPSITANTGYSSVGWSTSSGASSGTAAGGTYSISNSTTTLYANATVSYYTCTKRYRLQNADGTMGSYISDGTTSVAYNNTCSYSKIIDGYKSSATGTNGSSASTSCNVGSSGCTASLSFYRDTYALTVNRDTSYISSASATTTAVHGSNYYRWGQEVGVSATAATGSSFSSWSQTSGTTGGFATGVTRYSHTSNINDAGTASGEYGHNLNTNEVITISGATKLHITLTYQTESTSYDWVSFWEGNHPSYTASANYGSGVKCGGNTNGKYGGNTKTTIECDIDGDTVTFGFKSDGSVSNYGYYAVVTGYGSTSSTASTTFIMPKSAATILASGSANTYSLAVTFAGTGVSSVQIRTGSGTSGSLAGTVSTSGGSVSGLVYNTTYYLYPIFNSGYELSSWSNTGSYGTLSSTTATNPTFTMGAGNGAVTITGKSSCAVMQDYTFTTLSSLVPNTGDSVDLCDSRDGNTYKVAKLADGNIWMLDNLALDLVAKKDVLNSSNTNATDIELGYLKNGGGTTSDQYATSGVISWPSSSYSYSVPWVAVSGNIDGGGTWDVNTTVTSSGSGSGKVGAYYNYCAASAGTYCYGDGTSYGTSSGNATTDICPKGWRMPTGGDSGEYQALYTAYSSDATNFRNALSTPLSGAFGNGSAHRQGSGGFFWSSTWGGDYYMYELNVESSVVYPTSIGYRQSGFSVRCVMAPSTMQNATSSSLAKLMPNVGDTATLVDSRDGESYLIGHLADGKYWMLDNLRLGSTSTIPLDYNNTNLFYGLIWTLPASGSWSDSYTTAYINSTDKDKTTTSYGSGSGKIGVYYNYCAASAGNICVDSNSKNGSADQDICPKGWRMPTGGSSGEYQALYTAYSSNATNFRTALSTPLSGYFLDGSAYNQGSSGDFWSSTWLDSYSMHELGVGSSVVYPTSIGYRNIGNSVRCVLK